MKFNAYLFDFDGTLVDSMPAFASVMLKILDEYGVSYESDIIKVITPLGYGGSAEYFCEKLGVKEEKGKLLQKMQEMAYGEYAYNIPLKEGVLETLKKLKNCGCSLNILTASPHSVLDVCLKRLGIFELFENVWSCDDFATTKADVNIYKMAAGKIGTAIEKVLFLDDNLNADMAAKASGISVCGVFDKSSEEYAEEIKNVSDYYVYNLSEIFDIK